MKKKLVCPYCKGKLKIVRTSNSECGCDYYLENEYQCDVVENFSGQMTKEMMQHRGAIYLKQKEDNLA